MFKDFNYSYYENTFIHSVKITQFLIWMFFLYSMIQNKHTHVCVWVYSGIGTSTTPLPPLLSASPSIQHYPFETWRFLASFKCMWFTPCCPILGAFSKFRKATISFVMSVRLSVRPHGTTRLPLDGFSWDLTFEDFFFFKSVQKSQVPLKSDTLHEARYTFVIIYRSFLIRMRNVSYEFVEKIKTHILCSVTFFFRKSYRLWDKVEKYCRVGQATDDNIAHAHCMPDK